MKNIKVPMMRDIRLDHKWSLDHLSFYCGLPIRKLSLMERGLQRVVTDEDKRCVAEALGRSVDDCFAVKRPGRQR